MPSGYAHYRFGTQIIHQVPADVREPLLRQRALFDVGLHGPDFLYFHSFFKKTPLYHLGNFYHEKSGRDFFTGMCAHVKAQPSEAAFSYLYGLLAHYCLDCGCHPFVYAMTDDMDVGHSELETEFDRYLMALDGIKKPHEANISRHLRLKKNEYGVVAGFFPEITAKDAAACIRSMALSQQLLTIPTAPGHKAVELFTRFAGGNTVGKVMTVGPNLKCSHLNGKLQALYEQALAKYPKLLQQLHRHMVFGEAFGDDFNANFNRG
ncbi:MAG: hypothetical protein E7323_13495 [Clostridiales bacterium]|nr:hypothetical protein [Clostridiales bacterium]